MPTSRNAKEREKALQTHGRKCFICGATENIETHHVVPLSANGPDCASNIIPVCHSCHMKIHHSKDLARYKTAGPNTGRPLKCSKETAFKALDGLISGQYGNRRCAEIMGISRRSLQKGNKWYDEWMFERGIAELRNNYDLCAVTCPQRILQHDNASVGWVRYVNGETKEIPYKDGTWNDTTQYRIRGNNEVLSWKTIKDDLIEGE